LSRMRTSSRGELGLPEAPVAAAEPRYSLV